LKLNETKYEILNVHSLIFVELLPNKDHKQLRKNNKQVIIRKIEFHWLEQYKVEGYHSQEPLSNQMLEQSKEKQKGKDNKLPYTLVMYVETLRVRWEGVRVWKIKGEKEISFTFLLNKRYVKTVKKESINETDAKTVNTICNDLLFLPVSMSKSILLSIFVCLFLLLCVVIKKNKIK